MAAGARVTLATGVAWGAGFCDACKSSEVLMRGRVTLAAAT
jgi:hypothetical protein